MRAIVLATPHIEATHTLAQTIVQVLLLLIQLHCLESRNATCGYIRYIYDIYKVYKWVYKNYYNTVMRMFVF